MPAASANSKSDPTAPDRNGKSPTSGAGRDRPGRAAPRLTAQERRLAADRAERRAATLKRLEKSSGKLASAAIARMDDQLGWYRRMPPEHRSWIGLVAQAGIAAFTEWYRKPDAPQAISTDVFGTAPRELTRAITLRQTVELIRTTIEVMEEAIEEVAAPGDEADMRESVLVYAREIAFATAQVYAQAAEARGPGTPGWRPWWSTRCSPATPTRVCCPGPPRSAGASPARSGW